MRRDDSKDEYQVATVVPRKIWKWMKKHAQGLDMSTSEFLRSLIYKEIKSVTGQSAEETV